MNTRLQVEHPVTEEVTGLDLVALQLQVAEGEPLGLHQDVVLLVGHAIEVRVYAEDPVRDYLPSTGRIVRFDMPATQRARIESGYATGDVISPHYDAMVAKIICHGGTRAEASRRLARTLDQVWMPGPASNLPLLKQILATDAWNDGDLDTAFLSRVGLPAPPPLHVHEGVLAATVAAWSARRTSAELPAGWRLTGPATQRDRWSSFGVEVVATWRALDTDAVAVTVNAIDADHDGTPDEASLAARVRVLSHRGDHLHVDVDGVRHHWRVCTADDRPIGDGSVVYAHLGDGVEAMVRLEPRHPQPGVAAADPSTLIAPTPGTVVRVLVAEGDAVAEGDTLVVLEAMKMEHAARAGRDGVVGSVLVQVGDAVAEGAVLVRLVETEAV
jgi:acetyl/propionyl-CoA carboxylase alpha subunit